MSAQAEQKIRARCPGCQQQLAVPQRAAGKTVACPKCKHQFAVPHPSTGEGPVAAAPIPRPAALKSPAAARPPAPRPAAVSSAPVLPQSNAPAPTEEVFEAGLAAPPAEESSPFDFAAADQSPTAIAHRNAAADGGSGGGGFAMEKKGMQMGVLGGVLMMVLGAVWFVGGLAAGYIFFYAPILCVIGLVAFIKGIIDGNVAGGGGRRRRY